MTKIYELDYLEIIDMNNEELLKYSKKDLVRCLGQLAEECHELEIKADKY